MQYEQQLYHFTLNYLFFTVKTIVYLRILNVISELNDQKNTIPGHGNFGSLKFHVYC